MGKLLENEVELRKCAKLVRSLILEKHDIDEAVNIIKDHEEILTYNYGRGNYLTLLPTIRYDKDLNDKYLYLEKVIDAAFQIYKAKNDYEELAFFAAAKCDVDTLRMCLENRPIEDRRKTREGDTILLFLLKYGNLVNKNYHEIIKLLVLDYNLEVNKADYKNHSPILILLNKYASLQRKNITQFNETILEAVGILLTRKNVDMVSHKIHGKSATDIIELYNLKVILDEFKIKYKSLNRIESVVEDYMSVLFTLASEKNEDAFLQKINEIGFLEQHVGELQDGNNTLLQLACEKNLKKVVRYLLQIGATSDKTTKRNRKTPLEISARRNYYTIFKDILNENKIEIGSDLFAIFVLNRGRQIKTKYFDEILCYDRLKIDIAFQNGNTPLHYAIYFSNTEAVLKLLKRGASLTRKNNSGKDALHYISKEDLELYMDQCILIDNHNKLLDKKYELGFDFSGMITRDEDGGTNDVVSEVEIASRICASDRLKSLAKHPLMMTYIEIKWDLISDFYYKILLLYAFFFVYFAIVSYTLLPITFLYILLLFLLTFLTLQPSVEFSKFKISNTQNILTYALLLGYITLVHYLFKSTDFCVIFFVIVLLYQFLQQHLHFSNHQAMSLNVFRRITPYFLALFMIYSFKNFDYVLKNVQFAIIMFVVIICIIVINHSLNALIDSVTDIEYSLKTTSNKNALKFITFYENIYPFLKRYLNDPFVYDIFKKNKGKRYRINFYLNKNKFLCEKLHFLQVDHLTLKKLQDFVNITQNTNQVTISSRELLKEKGI